jgi:enoyl-CoA hydratase/carnithine racemase
MNKEELASAGLTYVVEDAVATVTLDRPEVRNAQTPRMWRALAGIGESMPDDVRVVVVRGSGQTFSAGLDRAMLDPSSGDGQETVAGLLALSDDEVSATIEQYQRGFTWLRDRRFVSVAVVQGYAIGAGFQLALACDLRVVADDVQFCMAETTLGIVPDLGGTYPLVHAVGYARAVEICLSGRRIGADEAVTIGLALRAVPRAELDAAVDAGVASLLGAPPKAAAETLGLLAGVAEGADPARALAAERAAQLRRVRSLAAGEG